MGIRFQQKRDTAANWTTNDPTLLSGEFGVETDTLKFKIGDGITAWTSLDYAATDGSGIISSPTSGQYTVKGIRLGPNLELIITYDETVIP